MKLRSALPHVLQRQYPTVRPEYPLLTVLYLLRMSDVAAVPLTSGGAKENRAVFGFSSLAKLLTLGPGRFGAFLREPCENASDQLSSVRADQDMKSLLEAFNSRRLGVAIVRGQHEHKGLVTLVDVLDLYSSAVLSSDACVEDVATPIFSLPESTSIRDAVKGMFSRRCRRVFVAGERGCVSDRSVMDRVFSPMVLDDMAENPRTDVLAAPISTLKREEPVLVSPKTPLKAAARKLRLEGAQCLVVDGERVVTPWDLVMKPWLAGKLTIR